MDGDEKQSFGLSSVNARLKLRYGDKYGLRISSEIGVYTEVFVSLPYIEKDSRSA